MGGMFAGEMFAGEMFGGGCEKEREDGRDDSGMTR